MTGVRPSARVVVTGATGFVGRVLVKQLCRSGYGVIGIAESAEPPREISSLLLDYFAVDMSAEWPDIGRFDGLVHLAGLSAVGPSFVQPQRYINVNSSMITNMFERLVGDAWRGRAVIVSSGAVYGHTGSAALVEDDSVAATSPYVISKLLVERQVEYYRRRCADALIVRPFNHIGPGQNVGFLVPDLAFKLASTQPGHPIEAGNLDSRRDYTDVRDVAAAYELLLALQTPTFDVYNVCSGTTRSGWEILEALCKGADRTVPSVKLRNARAIDPSSITGSYGRLNSETGWQPTIDVETTVADYLEDCQARP